MTKVDWFKHREDMKAAVLGSLGFSTDYIAGQTGLTYCQVLYRLMKAKIRRADYRNGDSTLASRVVQHVHNIAVNTLRGQLDKSLKPNPRKQGIIRRIPAVKKAV